MKFRTIFILFNGVILTSFLFVFFLPFFLLGAASSLSFWKGNWYLALLFLVLLGGLNAFFLLNRKTFVLVEREDWGELSAHLVRLMFPKGRFRSSRVRLLVNAYLLQSDIEGIERLEAELSSKRPDLLRKNALLFGVTRLLRGKNGEAETFFARYLDSKDVESRHWLRFDYGFSLVLQKKIAEALPYLDEGMASRDPVLCLLSAYLMNSVGVASAATETEKTRLFVKAAGPRERLRKRFTSAKWDREVESAKNEMHIVILSKLIDDAGRWLYPIGKA
ncbi:MAG: hypothetical protein ABSF43_11835 [Rectinemataceae bacterium]|jgi:hypothetical protein